MENKKHSSHTHPVLSQNQNNTTRWIGHLQNDPTDHFAGQTFKCPSEGLLNNIQVYSSSVHKPGDVALTLHEFDSAGKIWGPAIGDAAMFLQIGEDSRWVRFYLQPVPLKKDMSYGFRLQTNNALIGIGEAASHSQQPFAFGYEWNGDSKNEEGHYFSYFSLAFKVELCA
jgi:hypothetical protein